MRIKVKMIHTALIKINGIRSEIQEDLNNLELLRNELKDEKNKLKAELKILRRKQWIEDLNSIELEFREEL